ncbi:MAG: hypothetical protein E7507_02245 [Ruminococcus sp.]|nr:hypothetical protein [Ruminococcus sp.]
MSASKEIKNSAVALKYTPGKDYAPVVVASGHGHIADKIISLADESGIPIYRDDSAAALLTMLKVGKSVPPDLYELIASIYVEILKTSGNLSTLKK